MSVFVNAPSEWVINMVWKQSFVQNSICSTHYPNLHSSYLQWFVLAQTFLPHDTTHQTPCELHPYISILFEGIYVWRNLSLLTRSSFMFSKFHTISLMLMVEKMKKFGSSAVRTELDSVWKNLKRGVSLNISDIGSFLWGEEGRIGDLNFTGQCYMCWLTACFKQTHKHNNKSLDHK